MWLVISNDMRLDEIKKLEITEFDNTGLATQIWMSICRLKSKEVISLINYWDDNDEINGSLYKIIYEKQSSEITYSRYVFFWIGFFVGGLATILSVYFLRE